MSTIIFLIVFIIFEELTRKNIGFTTVDDEYQKLHSCLVLEIINCILVKEHRANRSVGQSTYFTLW